MDDITTETPASETEREAEAVQDGSEPCLPGARRVGPESEVRGGPEAPRADPGGPDPERPAQGA